MGNKKFVEAEDILTTPINCLSKMPGNLFPESIKMLKTILDMAWQKR